jgi:quercetin dioxygenase-like cupin family protein
MDKPPAGHKVLFENDRVRVLDVRINPGETSEMHTHPANFVYALSSAQVVFSFPDGTSREVTIKEGDIAWSEGTTHEVKNIGETPDWGIIVELKK